MKLVYFYRSVAHQMPADRFVPNASKAITESGGMLYGDPAVGAYWQ